MIAKRKVTPVRKAAFRVCKGRIVCASAIRHVDAIGRYPPHSERGRMAALRARYAAAEQEQEEDSKRADQGKDAARDKRFAGAAGTVFFDPQVLAR